MASIPSVVPGSQPQSPVQMRQPVITPALQSALFSAKDRSFIVSLEQDLLNFIGSHTDSYLLRPMNSYYRMLTHQTAEYYGLGHSLNKEGNSIVVFKNFGSDPAPPVPLVSIPFDAPAIPVQPQMFPQSPIPGAAPLPYGMMPYGFQNAIRYHHPQLPYNKVNNRYQGRSSQNRHLHNSNTNHNNNHNRQHQQQLNDPISSQKTPTEEKVASPALPQIKLMKRTDTATGTKDTTEDATSISPSQDKSPSCTTTTSTTTPATEQVDPETERATREVEYQKARERIFQNGDDEVDPDLIDDMSNLSFKPLYTMPASLPPMPSQPQYVGYIPQPAAGHMAQYAFYQPQHGYQHPQMVMYDPTAGAASYGQPMYYNPMAYNSGGGHRKKGHGHNNSNRHRNGNGYRYSNHDRKEVQEEHIRDAPSEGKAESDEKTEDGKENSKKDVSEEKSDEQVEAKEQK
ncbi:CYFA0S03e00276g1_1 [Cyberlindnera fabianii]|uniref:CYFA0S03e00276g1_1 n=1 Tax=Cyberlindnera fabianii TaxID=36022 RepID=A0A061AUV0_CYBFA|nr:RNA-binding suppressor of PAS kinase protein 1 [Cyberlindnera fabianii]CDR39158.1 CYFA0S03e00276g1_1 [Cyberlindnera fabianii]